MQVHQEHTTTLYKEASKDALDYLIQTRGLSADTIKTYQVGATQLRFGSENPQLCLTFPWLQRVEGSPEEQLIRYKVSHPKTTQPLVTLGWIDSHAASPASASRRAPWQRRKTNDSFPRGAVGVSLGGIWWNRTTPNSS